MNIESMRVLASLPLYAVAEYNIVNCAKEKRFVPKIHRARRDPEFPTPLHRWKQVALDFLSNLSLPALKRQRPCENEAANNWAEDDLVQRDFGREISCGSAAKLRLERLIPIVLHRSIHEQPECPHPCAPDTIPREASISEFRDTVTITIAPAPSPRTFRPFRCTLRHRISNHR